MWRLPYLRHLKCDAWATHPAPRPEGTRAKVNILKSEQNRQIPKPPMPMATRKHAKVASFASTVPKDLALFLASASLRCLDQAGAPAREVANEP
jgi:hypothetical protein